MITSSENTFYRAISLLYERLGLSSYRELWEKAGLQTNMAAWYDRVSPDPAKARPARASDLEKLEVGLYRTSGIRIPEDLLKIIYDAAKIDLSVRRNFEQIFHSNKIEGTATQLESYSPYQPIYKQKSRRARLIALFRLINLILVSALALIGAIVILINVFEPIPPVSLEVSDGLSLSTTTVKTGGAIDATFTIKNTGTNELKIQRLTLGVRLGAEWKDPNYDFGGDNNIILQPGKTYVYKKTQIFLQKGRYFAEPTVQIRGQWGGIANYPRLYFEVVD